MSEFPVIVILKHFICNEYCKPKKINLNRNLKPNSINCKENGHTRLGERRLLESRLWDPAVNNLYIPFTIGGFVPSTVKLVLHSN